MTSTVLCVIAAALVMAAVVRHMLGRLVAVRDALQDIASGEGDLTRRMNAEGHDELAQIGQSFNAFTDKIASVLQRIRDASESVRLATSEIASGNNDLSSRTEQQASSSRKPHRPWNSSPPRCNRTLRTHARPTSWPPAPRKWLARAAV